MGCKCSGVWGHLRFRAKQIDLTCGLQVRVYFYEKTVISRRVDQIHCEHRREQLGNGTDSAGEDSTYASSAAEEFR